jgi:hypothetical protein
MNRSTFLKSLFLLAASPKVLAEIKMAPKPIYSNIFNDLQFVIPDWTKQIVEKYGAENYTAMLDCIGNGKTYQFYHFEKDKILTSTIPVSEPVTITLTKENIT